MILIVIKEYTMDIEVYIAMREYVTGYNFTHQTIDNHYPIYIGNVIGIA